MRTFGNRKATYQPAQLGWQSVITRHLSKAAQANRDEWANRTHSGAALVG